uniref:Ubiquitin carboxyl-terminal hydrolase n=2 Tax=Mesocestoides corti TaxID=53468 RepID=A0A5K3F0P4_MESCO
MAKRRKERFTQKDGVLIQGFPKGLHNQGNTCYFNAILQCLCRVSGLKALVDHFLTSETRAVLKRSTDKGDVHSLDLYLPRLNAPLSTAYTAFAEELFGSQNTRPSITPEMLRAALVKQYPRFGDFGQHDSHEVLRCLLDGLRQDELKLWQRAILNKLHVDAQAAGEVKTDVRSWGRSTGLSTSVDRVFGGLLLTSFTCNECESTTQHFEVFLDLSLPILIDGETGDDVLLHGSYKAPRDYGDNLPKSKRELKRERRAKKNRGKLWQLGIPVDDEVDDEPNGGDEDIHPKKGDLRTKRKGRYSNKFRLPSEDEEENSGKEGEEEKQEEDQDQCLNGETAGNTANGEADTEIGGASSDASFGSLSSEEPLENCTNGALSETADNNEADSCQIVAENGISCNGEVPREATGESDVVSVGLTTAEKSSNLSLNGASADVEDNEGGGLSDSSAPTPPADVNNSLANDLSTKLHISPAGFTTSIAQPSEEERARAVSQKPILQAPPPSTLTDLERCLLAYTDATKMNGLNQVVCEVCSKRSGFDNVLRDTVKRDLIIRPPAVLTLHLKRFQQAGARLQKSSKRITFPINLDLRPYCSRLARLSSGEGQYRLFGVVEHAGHLRGGHYVCYVPDEPPQRPLPDLRFVPTLEKPDPWPMYLHHLVYQLRRADDRVIYGCPVDDDNPAAPLTDSRRWLCCNDSRVARVSLSTVLNAEPYILFYERVR